MTYHYLDEISENWGSKGKTNHGCFGKHKAKTIQVLFEEQVKKTPNHRAVVFQNHGLTYCELNNKANQMARYLKAKGVMPEEKIGIFLDRSVEMMVAILAILKAGACYVPIAPDYPEERVQYIAKDSQARWILTQSQWKHSPLLGTQLVNLDEVGWKEEVGADLEEMSTPNNLAYVIYTSGTTGTPKGVMIEHHSVVNLVEGLYENIYSKYDTALNIALLAPYTFDASIKQIFPALLLGHTLYIAPEEARLDGKELLQFFHAYAIDVSDGTPSHLAILLHAMGASGINLPVSHFVIGGEALQANLVTEFLKQFKKNPPCITNVYGPTECCDVTTLYTVDQDALPPKGSVPIGFSIPNTKVYVLDKDLNPCAAGEEGELYIAGAGVGRGYLNQPEMTKECFLPDREQPQNRMYKTGDLVRVLGDGNIEYIGRSDQQVKIRGFRIELGEIEAVLSKHPSVMEAAVIARESPEADRYICVYYTSRERLTVQEAKEFLSKYLPSYMIPSYFVHIDALPLTHNGKVDKKALPEPGQMEAVRGAYIVPRNKFEKQLAHIWEKVLKTKPVGIEDHFFELGGHSLNANVLSSLIHKELGVEVPIRVIFQKPILKELACWISHAETKEYHAIQPVQQKEYYPVSPAQKWIYMSHRLNNGDITWNMPGVMIIEGEVDVYHFKQAFQKLVQRHDTMRTSFVLHNDELVQFIHEDIRWEMCYWEADEGQVEAILKEFIRPFDLGKVPLFRIGLVKLAKGKHAFLFDMHHIVFDGVSVDILVKEFTSLYQGIPLSPLKIQYKDYAQWRHELSQTKAYKNHEAYWLNQFAEGVPFLDFPTDYPRILGSSIEGGRIVFTVDGWLLDAIKKLTVETGTTLYIVLLATYNVLLYRYSGQEEIVVGTFGAGRPHSELQHIIGMFVNTIVMKNEPQGEKTLIEFLHEVKENAFEAYEHQDYPYEELVEKLNPSRGSSSQSLYNTLLILQNFEQAQFDIQGLKFEPYDVDLKISPMDFTLEAREEEKRIKFTLTYKTKLFRKETMELFVENFIRLLQELVENRNKQLKEIEIKKVSILLENILSDEIDFEF